MLSKEKAIIAGGVLAALGLGYFVYKKASGSQKQTVSEVGAPIIEEPDDIEVQKVIAQTQNQERTLIQKDLSVCDNERLGIKFKYPTSWKKVVEQKYPVTVMQFYLAEEEDAGQLLVITEELAASISSMEYFTKSKETIVNVTDFGVNFDKESETTLGGHEAYELEYTQKVFVPAQNAILSLKAWNTVTVVGKRAYCIQFIAKPEKFDKDSISDVLETMEINYRPFMSSSSAVFQEAKYGMTVPVPKLFHVQGHNENENTVVTMSPTDKEVDASLKIAKYSGDFETLKADKKKNLAPEDEESEVQIGDITGYQILSSLPSGKSVMRCFQNNGVCFIATATTTPELHDYVIESLDQIRFQSTNEDTDVVVYSNPEGGFKITVPSYMDVLENVLGEPAVTFLYIPKEETLDETPMTETSISIKHMGQPFSYDEMVHSVRQDLAITQKQSMILLKIDSESKVRIDGTDAYQIVYSSTPQVMGGLSCFPVHPFILHQQKYSRPIEIPYRYKFTEEEVQSAPPHVRQIVSWQNASDHELHRKAVQEQILKFGRFEGDTGSSEVQIAVLTERIKLLTAHLMNNKQDKVSKYNLNKMVCRRKKLMEYLKRKKFDTYWATVRTLGLRNVDL